MRPAPRRFLPSRCLAGWLVVLGACGLCPAKDWFLTIGGGPEPRSNQASLEKNVQFFQSVLATRYPNGVTHDILFADGQSPDPDLQYLPADRRIPWVNVLMARLFGTDENLGVRYRDHQIAGGHESASRENVQRWFETTGPKTRAGDRLFLYATAHGGRSMTRGRPRNTRLHLWNNGHLDVGQLAAHLATLPAGVEVILVMVQCHSGGFADLLFANGDDQKPPVDRRVCGFFATVHDRLSAGCSPDIDDENYREYSSSFWAALHGTDRLGRPVPSADYDGDGRVSFEEAHCFTLLAAETIDVPIRTSDVLLRAHSRPAELTTAKTPNLASPYEMIFRLARPAQAAALTALSNRLELTGDGRATAAAAGADRLEEERRALGGRVRDLKRDASRCREQLRADLLRRWPELRNPFSPTALGLLGANAEQFIAAVESHRDFSRWNDALNEAGKLEDQRFQLEKRWALHHRFFHLLESIVLAANLENVADAPTLRRYHDLLAAESGSLAGPGPKAK